MFWIVFTGIIFAVLSLMGVAVLTGRAGQKKPADGSTYSAEDIKKAKPVGAVFLAIGIAGLLTVFSWHASYTSIESVAERAAEEASKGGEKKCGSTIDAGVMAEEFVGKRLLVPQTAKFAPFKEIEVTRTASECEFLVVSYVDAQNVMGASVRNYFSVVVRYVPSSNKWQLVELDM